MRPFLNLGIAVLSFFLVTVARAEDRSGKNFWKPMKIGGGGWVVGMDIHCIYRSTGEGTTWDKIGTWPLGIFDWIDAVDGDKDVFGKVYLGFTSSGFAFGEEAN